MTPNKPPDSKTVEIISYCAWNESRVKIIKLIAECAMAKKLPCTQRLDKYEIHVEKREGTLSFSPKKQVDLRASIQNFSDLECVYDKPMVQTMVIEAVVGKSAFKTKLNNLISKVRASLFIYSFLQQSVGSLIAMPPNNVQCSIQ